MVSIPEQMLEIINSGDFKMKWMNFRALEPPKVIMNKVKDGIKIKFPVRVIMDELYEEFPNTKRIRVKGFGMIDYYKFKDEIEERELEMLKYIYENYDQDTTKGRVNEDE